MPIIQGMEYYICNEIFKFKPNCKLKAFISKYCDPELENFTLMEITNKLHDIIRRQQMLDANNKSIIVCTPELEDVLNMSGLHTLELLSAVTEHVKKATFLSSYEDFVCIQQGIQKDLFTTTNQKENYESNTTKQQKLYHVDDNLYKIISEDSVRPVKLEDLLELVSSYIHDSTTIEIDSRNMKIAYIGNDPLGQILQMKVFHSSQIQYILSHFVTPIDSNIPKSNETPKVIIEEATQNIASIYLTSTVAERMLDENLCGYYIDRTTCTHEHTNSPLTVSPDQEEYELESEPERIRPPQAMGKTSSLSSADNTDTDENSPNPFAIKLDALLTTSDHTETNGSNSETKTINHIEENVHTASSSQVNSNKTLPSLALIFSTIRKAIIYEEINCETTFPEKNKIRLNISVKDSTNINSDLQELESEDTEHKTITPNTNKFADLTATAEIGREELLAKIDVIIRAIKEEQNTKSIVSNPTKNIAEIFQRSFLQTCKEMLLKWNVENTYFITKIKEILKAEELAKMILPSVIDKSSIQHTASNKPSTSKQCINCKKTMNTLLPRCKECWMIRKQWIPNRPRKTKSKTRQIQESKASEMLTNPCQICFQREKNSILIHGKKGHQVACYPCAKKAWNTRSDCPICKRKIEKIVKIYA